MEFFGFLAETKNLLEISSQKFGPIFFLELRRPHALGVRFAEDAVTVADLIVDKNVIKVLFNTGKWIKIEVRCSLGVGIGMSNPRIFLESCSGFSGGIYPSI